MCSSASPTRWCVQGVLSYTCTRDDCEVDARSPIGEAGSQRTHKSRYAQSCSLFPKGSRSPASPAHLKKNTHRPIGTLSPLVCTMLQAAGARLKETQLPVGQALAAH